MRGELDGQEFALLYDRLALGLGGLQRYGSQLGRTPEAGLFVSPLEDPDNVDARRAELGMIPLVQYLEFFRKDGGPLPRHFGDGRSFGP